MARAKKSRRGRLNVFLIVVVVAAWGIWGLVRIGPEPLVALVPERNAIGAPTEIQARFREPKSGIGTVRLELLQGENRVELAIEEREHPSPWLFWKRGHTDEVVLTASVGLRGTG